MGLSHSSYIQDAMERDESNQDVRDFDITEPSTPPSEPSTPTSEKVETTPSEPCVYTIVHNGEIKFYIPDLSLLNQHCETYTRRVFSQYISRWDAYNFYISQQEALTIEEEERGLVKTIKLISRAKHFLGRFDQIEEEIHIYKVPLFCPTEEETVGEELVDDSEDEDSENEEQEEEDSEEKQEEKNSESEEVSSS